MSTTTKQSKASKKIHINPSNNYGYVEIIDIAILLVICLTLLIAPFYRGLYFRENFIPAIAIISLIFILQIMAEMVKGDSRVFSNYLDIGLLGLTLAYAISLVTGLSKMNSLDGFLKYAAAFMLYLTIVRLSKDVHKRRIFINVLALSGYVVALSSMLGSAGLISIKGVFGFGERLTGLYQYPNATASVLGALYLLSVNLLLCQKNKIIRILYLISSSTIVLAFLETRSRGGMLVLLAGWLLSLLLLKGKEKINFILYSGLSAVPTLLLYDSVFESFTNKSGFIAIYFILIAANIAVGLLLEYLRKYTEKINDKIVNRTLIAMVVLFVAAALAVLNITVPLRLTKDSPTRAYEIYTVKPGEAYTAELSVQKQDNTEGNILVLINSVSKSRERTELYNSQFTIDTEKIYPIEFKTIDSTMYITVEFKNASGGPIQVNSFGIEDKRTGNLIEQLKLRYRFIPDDIAKKIDEISLKTESSSERLVFIKDGLKMFKDNFLFGTGAKGWSLLYQKYQLYGYVSNEAHNYYLQTAIEAGLLGIISMVVLLVTISIACFKLYLKTGRKTGEVIGLTTAVFVLLAHAFIDFDLSLFAILILLYALLGVLTAMANEEGILVFKLKKQKIISLAGILVSVVIFIISTTVYTGIVEGDKGSKAIKDNPRAAKEHYEKAISRGFYNMAYIVDYSQLLNVEAEKTGNKSLISTVYDNYKKVEKYEQYDMRYYPVILDFYLRYGYLEDADKLIERSIELQPLKSNNYEIKASINNNIMVVYLQNKDYKKALEYCNNVIEVEEQHKAANENTIAPFDLTENTRKIIEEAKKIKPQIEQNAN